MYYTHTSLFTEISHILIFPATPQTYYNITFSSIHPNIQIAQHNCSEKLLISHTLILSNLRKQISTQLYGTRHSRKTQSQLFHSTSLQHTHIFPPTTHPSSPLPYIFVSSKANKSNLQFQNTSVYSFPSYHLFI